MPRSHSKKQERQVKKNVSGAGLPAGDAYAAMGKSPVGVSKSSRFDLMTIDDCYASFVKADGQAAMRRTPDSPPPSVSDVSSRPKKFPRRLKPTVRMKPITDAEMVERNATGTREVFPHYEKKSLRWLAALKALATGYSKVSGGGALKGANRGWHAPPYLGPDGRKGKTNRKGQRRYRRALRRAMEAMEAMSAPVGHAKPPSVYLPGVHNPKSPVRPASGIKKPATLRKPALKKTYPTLNASTGSSNKKILAAGGAAELSNSHKPNITKGSSVATTNFNDLFKSELGTDDVLTDCPHCSEPITKSDLSKAHKGKGATTNLSGPKHGKSSAHVRDHNPEGGTMRGGDGHGVHTSSRGVPGAKKTDEVRVVGNKKGKPSGVSKADTGSSDDASGESSSDDVMSKSESSEPTKKAADPVKKALVTIRGTEFVQYIDDGSDARIAKAISEGATGGTTPTHPMALDNDLARLLI